MSPSASQHWRRCQRRGPSLLSRSRPSRHRRSCNGSSCPVSREATETIVLDQAFEQVLQLANLRLHGESCIRYIADVDGQQAIVVISRQLRDDPPILDFALTDPHLKLVGPATRIAQVDMAHEGKDL